MSAGRTWEVWARDTEPLPGGRRSRWWPASPPRNSNVDEATAKQEAVRRASWSVDNHAGLVYCAVPFGTDPNLVPDLNPDVIR